MNAKYGMAKKVSWIAALVMATAVAAPAAASDVTAEIRSQGERAIDAMRADIRPSLAGVEVPAAKRAPLTVDESIRVGGRVAMRSMQHDLNIVRTASPVGPPEMLDRKGLVTVSTFAPDDAPTDSESL